MSDDLRLDNPYGRFLDAIGSRADRPFKILLPILAHSFGDIFIITACAARFAAAFAFSHCSFLFDTKRPYLADLVQLYPFPSDRLVINQGWGDIRLMSLVAPPTQLDWREPNYHDFVLTSAFLSTGVAAGYPRCPLRLPETLVPAFTERLIGLGLDPDRWFCTIHWREPSYAFKPGPTFRDVDPLRFHALIHHVIDRLGGQVVVLGHPELTRPAPRDGLVDLSALPDSWMLQSFAMSRSRYFAGSASAGSAMAFAFMVPATHLNATDWYVGEPEDRVLTPTVTLKDGRRLRLRELQQSGWLNSIRIRQGLETGDVVSVEHPDVGDMVRSVELIHAETAGLNGWRPEPPLCQGRPDNRIPMPAVARTQQRFVDL